MKKQNRKAFTLVELLVVIAILAVLATVSIVGYTSFSQKAKASNALTEMRQAKEVINAELLQGEYVFTDKGELANDASDDVKYSFVISGGKFLCNNVNDAENPLQVVINSDLVKLCFPELADLKGQFSMGTNSESLIYNLGGARVEWNFASGEIATLED